jgi:predicted  nucleic acid-binding Zn-ribbon protein
MNTKIVPLILLIVIVLIAIMAFVMYQENTALKGSNEQLSQDKTILVEENNELNYKATRAERQAQEAQRQLEAVQTQLSALEKSRAADQQKISDLTSERDLLIEKVKATASKQVMTTERYDSPDMDVPEEHWADFVKKKASLQAQVVGLEDELLEAKSRISGLDKDNKEVSIKMDQLSKEKQRLEDEIKFKERTLRVMSMDLVSEREERSAAVRELTKLRSENVSLKRELVLANKEQMKLQESLRSSLDKKSSLENRITDAENILKEKSLAFGELQDQLKTAIVGGKRITASESASVELPPIVVKPSAPGLRGIRGEIIAVNREEKFVVVDLGEASGVRPGVLLKVMRADREIATLEVIETRKEISAADIREVVGGFTIQEGDIVLSR